MTDNFINAKGISSLTFLSGGGQVGQRIREFDWTTTPLGHPATWPQSLKTCVRILLTSPQPMFVWWGRDTLITIYNDAYSHILGDKHPAALGCAGNMVWKEIWQTVGARADVVFTKNEGTYDEALQLVLNRYGFDEETYFNFSYSPIPDDSGETAGLFCVCTEETEKVATRKKLEATNHRLQFAATLSENIADAVVGVSTEQEGYRITSWNKGAETIYGWTTHEAVGRLAQEVMVSKFSGEEDRKLVQNVLNEKGSWRGEVIQSRKDGTQVWIDSSVALIKDDEAKVLGAVAVNRDITKQKEAEEKVKDSEARFKLALRGSSHIVFSQDKDLKHTWIYNSQPDFNANLIVGKDDAELYEPGTAHRLTTIKKGVLHSGTAFHGEVEMLVNKIPLVYDLLIEPIKSNTGEMEGITGVAVDITDKVSAKNKVEESESKIRNFILQAPVAMCIYKGPSYVVEMVNTRMLNIWGKPLNAVIGRPVFEALPEAKGQGFEALLDNVYTTGETFTAFGISLTLLRDGQQETIYVNLLYEAYREADGTISGIVEVANEVTAQVMASKKLKESEEEFRNFSNNIQNLAWMADGDGYIYWYNQRWYDYTGTTLEEMKGWGWNKVHHPAFINDVVAFVKEAWNKPQPFELTFPLRSHDGEYRWFLTRVVPVLNADGTIKRWVGTNTDVNEQILAEGRFRTLAESLPQLVWMTDDKGSYEYASSQWQQYSGLDPRDESTWEKLVHPQDMPAMMKAWEASLQTCIPYLAEARLKSKEGEYRWHAVQGKAVQNEEGKASKWIGAFSDIHDQKTLAKKLEALVSERTRELQLSNESLQQFAHVASHDLKEPVRKIKTFAGRLEEELQPLLTDRARLYFDKVQSATDRMFSMIDGVLTYSTVDASQQNTGLVDLNLVLQNIDTDVEVAVQQKGAVIQYKNLPVIEGAQVLLYQLFYNLVNNSLKFTRAGVKPVITITSKKMGEAGKYAQITVADNGVGFAQAQAEKIFNPFARLYSKDQFDGTGLGLSLCKKIAERHHGSIVAQGELNEGATFIITLPYHQSATEI